MNTTTFMVTDDAMHGLPVLYYYDDVEIDDGMHVRIGARQALVCRAAANVTLFTFYICIEMEKNHFLGQHKYINVKWQAFSSRDAQTKCK